MSKQRVGRYSRGHEQTEALATNARPASSTLWGDEFGDDYIDLGYMPDTVPRRCTDAGWAVIFIVCLGAYAACTWHAFLTGELNKLESFDDGRGHECQMDGPTPFLFFCRNKSGLHDMERPICRRHCPTSTNTSHEDCASPDYRSVPILGMLCVPEQPTGDGFEDSRFWAAQKTAELSVMFRIIAQRWRSLLACSAIAIFASYIEIYILENNAGCLLRFGIFTMGFGSLIAAAGLMNWFARLGIAVGESHYYTGAALVLALLGMFFVMLLCFSRDSIDTASDCIELACRCVLQTRSLSLHPLVAVVCHQANNMLSLYSLLLVLSDMREGLIGGQGLICDYFGWSVKPHIKVIIVVIMCMMIWIHQVLFAISEFVAAYATVQWYFAEDNGGGRRFKLKAHTIFHAWWEGFRYHLGTLALGGTVIGWARAFRSSLGFLFGWTYLDNPLSKLFNQIFCCFAWLFESMKPLHKNAFIDVAMSSRPFFEAAHSAEVLARKEQDAFRILNGATSLFQAVGLSAAAGFGACTMAFICVVLVDDDPGVTVTMVGAGAIFAALTAWPFALIFDTVSDTILYCSGIDDLRREQDLKSKNANHGSYMVARICPCIFRPPLRDIQSFAVKANVDDRETLLGELDGDFELKAQDPTWLSGAVTRPLDVGNGKGLGRGGSGLGQGKGGPGFGQNPHLNGQPS